MRALAILALVCFAGPAPADDKKPAEEKKPTGSWTKKIEGFDVKVSFKKDDKMVFSMTNSNETIEIETKCTFEKDGLVKCKILKFSKNGNFPELKDGFEFSFKIKIEDKIAKVSDLMAPLIEDMAKSYVEGDYEKATD